MLFAVFCDDKRGSIEVRKANRDAHLDYIRSTGVVAQAGMTSVMDMLRTLDPEMQAAQVDLSKTFTDRFVKASPVKMQ